MHAEAATSAVPATEPAECASVNANATGTTKSELVATEITKIEQVAADGNSLGDVVASEGFTEVSHDVLWASMQTVVVRDCAPRKQELVEDSSDSGDDVENSATECDWVVVEEPAIPKQSATTMDSVRKISSVTMIKDGENPPVAVGLLGRKVRVSAESSGSSTPTSSSSSTHCVEVEVQGTSIVKTDGTDIAWESAPLAFNDLFGSINCQTDVQPPACSAGVTGEIENEAEDAVEIPSVEEAQQHLDDILARRSQIKAMSAKYSPSDGAVANSSKSNVAPQLEQCIEVIAAQPCRPSCDATTNPEHAITESKDDAEKGPLAPAPASPKLMPARFCGPGVRPGPSEVADVMQHLGARLRQLSAANKTASGAALQEASCGDKKPSNSSDRNVRATKQSSSTKVGAGFTIGGHSTSSPPLAATPGERTPIESLVSRPKVAVDENRLRAAREQEEHRTEELWRKFLAGDDLPVGDDGLPPPDSYYAG